jgi:hypothetical protein
LPELNGFVLWIYGTLNLLFRYGSHGEKESYEFRRLYREKNNYVVSHQVFGEPLNVLFAPLARTCDKIDQQSHSTQV